LWRRGFEVLDDEPGFVLGRDDGTSLEDQVRMRKNWPEITGAFALGIGVGAILGLLLAPHSGEETRALLREKAQEGIDGAVEQGKRVARKAQKAADGAKEFVNDAVEAGQGAYREARNS
jgi:gas vesicle protein